MTKIRISPVNEECIRPIWSVVIPTYNDANHLEQAINSVLIQDRGKDNMEIIVVDDCSDNHDPFKLIMSLPTDRITYYKQTTNVGQYENFKTCLSLTKGRIIHLLHGDDFIHDGFYLSLEQAMLDDTSIGAGFTRNNYVNHEGKTMFNSAKLTENAEILLNFIYTIASGQVIQTPAIAVKREVYEHIGGFDSRLSWCEDWEMWIRIAASNYNFYYVPSILASYRMHNYSNTSKAQKGGSFIDDICMCIRIYCRYMPLPKKEIKLLANNAKCNSLKYALNIYSKINVNEIDDRLLILSKCLKLCTSFTTLFWVLENIVLIYLKKLSNKFTIYIKN